MLEPLCAGKHKIYIYGKAVFPDGSEFVTEMNHTLNEIPKNKRQ
jgi:hypothetical protein